MDSVDTQQVFTTLIYAQGLEWSEKNPDDTEKLAKSYFFLCLNLLFFFKLDLPRERSLVIASNYN